MKKRIMDLSAKLVDKNFSIFGYKISGRSVTGHPLFSGSFLMVGGSMGVNVINYLYHLVMGRVLGPVNYGILASIFSVLYIISIVPMSASISIVKFVSSAKDMREAAGIFLNTRNLVLKISLTGALLILFLSKQVSNFLHIENIFLVLTISPIIIFSLLWLVNQATLQGLLVFEGFVYPNLLGSLGRLVLGLLLVYVGLAVMGAMWGILLGYVLAYLYSFYMVKKKIRISSKAHFDLAPLLKFSVPALLQALAFTSIFTLDLILVKHFLPPYEAGLYAALSTLGKIIYFAVTPITSVMFPIVSKRRVRGENYRKVFYAALIATALLSFSIAIFYYLLPDLAIGLLYGKEYLSVRNELVWMGLFITVYTLSYLLVNFLLSLGRTKIVSIPIIVAILQIVAIWFFHETVLQVIQVSLLSVLFMFFGVGSYLVYIQVKKIYAKS